MYFHCILLYAKITTISTRCSLCVCTQRVVLGAGNCPLHAGQRHVVLLGVEAAQSQVVEQLSVGHAHLKEATVEPV